MAHDVNGLSFTDLMEESICELDEHLSGCYTDGEEDENLEEEFLSEDEELDEYCLLSLSDEELSELREELGIDVAEMDGILEATVKRVNSRGQISRTKDRKTRKRQASRTTGLSKTQRKQRARKAARTKKRSPGKLKKAVKKRNRAMKRRRQLSLS